MNQEIKKLWVDALRSGEYIQGYGQLVSYDDKFCCLGVLCDVYSNQYEDLEKKMNGFLVKDNHNMHIENSVLPDVVKNWAGLGSRNPDVTFQQEDLPASFRTLSNVNDQFEQGDFNFIAELIEQQL